MKNEWFKFFGLLLTVLISLQTGLTQSQLPDNDRSDKSFGIRLGFKQVSLLDRNTSSLIYRGSVPVLGFEFRKTKGSGYYLVDIQAGRGTFFPKKYPDRQINFLEEDVSGEVKSVMVPMRGKTSIAHLKLGYLHRVSHSENAEWYLGALMSDEMSYQQGFVTPGLMNVASASPMTEVRFHSGNRTFVNLSVAIPIASLTTRSAYHNSVSLPNTQKFAGFWANGTRFESLGQHRQINISASIYRNLGDHFQAGFQYQFAALKNQYPRELKKMENEFSLTLRFLK
jgi:hypothetical protein